MTKLRWGVVGAAKIADAILNGARGSRYNEVVGVAARDSNRAAQWASERGVPRVFESYSSLVASDEIDAVYIPLTNNLHMEWTVRAAERGKHVLCEKPFAMNASEVDRMIAAADRHHVKLMEAFMYRFHPQMPKAKRLVAEGLIGRVKFIRAAFDYQSKRPPTDLRWHKELGGGALLDVGSYCVNGALFFAESPPRAVTGSGTFTKDDVDESFAGLIEFQDDVRATFTCSFRAGYNTRLEIQGTTGMLTLLSPWRTTENPMTIVYSHDEREEVLSAPAVNHYREMLDHFADCVANDTPVAVSPQSSRTGMAVIDALFKSAREGRRVTLSD